MAKAPPMFWPVSRLVIVSPSGRWVSIDGGYHTHHHFLGGEYQGVVLPTFSTRIVHLIEYLALFPTFGQWAKLS